MRTELELWTGTVERSQIRSPLYEKSVLAGKAGPERTFVRFEYGLYKSHALGGGMEATDAIFINFE